MTPHDFLWLLVIVSLLALCGVVAWLFHWFVLDWRYWFRRTPEDLPGPDMPARAGEYQRRLPVAQEIMQEIFPEPVVIDHDDWDRLNPDQAADQLIAEWHDEGNERWAGDWLTIDLNDPDAIVWDAKQQAARCWEILHVEFPRLRAELAAA